MKIKLNEVVGFEEMEDYYFVVRDGDTCWVEGKKGELKSSFEKTGYKHFGLYQKDGKKKMMKEHRLFAICFIENPESKPVINHIDNNPSNNLLSNLEWVTQSENIIHASKQNRLASGERNGFCKISDKQVEEIFELRKTGLTQKQIANLICCSQTQICHILSGKLRSKSTKFK